MSSQPVQTTASLALSDEAALESNKAQRYIQLMLLVLAAGAIYPILYLRQVYQPTMLEVFHITDSQLGYLYSMLGTIFLLSYLPSGWLADRIAPRLLICFSLIATGVLGLWYSTAPSFNVLMLIFGGWGLSTGLTFWAAVIKRVTMIAGTHEQGRFFGLLDGGRGLIEAMLATIAITLFAWFTQTKGEPVTAGFRLVVYMYAFLCIALGVVLALVKDPQGTKDAAANRATRKRSNVLLDLKTLASIPELWLVAAIVFCGYQVFWATYSFSAYLHEGEIGLTVVMAGTITTLKLWMRPIGGIGGGFLGDRYSKVSVLVIALFLAAVSLLGLMAAPRISSHVLLVFLVLFIGILTYAIRGLYWSLLDRCNIPVETMGLAIGLISVLGYSPDVFLPLINGYLTQNFPGVFGYQLYFGYVAGMAALGGFAGLALRNMLSKKGVA
ncbi:MFS transporter [Paraburkholderia fungorum]|uniref:MFS family permease n=1 Tax=Paraburkholderia fungorum TaxID=134537 RepID=A0AAW3UWH3_9BURK|nr:MFS transporter [Paraburkholderia fungorum]KFX60669.1 MFS transporter [Burkholderia sp. K24]MBB4515061.1 MFS family permease [Paraburkholderia fungorum]MBB5544758.1 MFS family permease [Paraburkholderia fungorum]MBB6203004.1 MFS family permease [Paraburkholderia fungorum]PNE56110.1 MFS transporter [Paraburkholderia fungorum]